MKLRHFFLPHPETHKKAHLISVQAVLVYIFLFLALQVGFSYTNKVNPGVLGISSSITIGEVINLTNLQRQKIGDGVLSEDSRLDAAAAAKAQNMFAENYWAHYSPSGKDPWGFIQGAGYKFTYAGENLARNFYNSNDVVNAWMASPTHKENLLNSHYTNIGIAVAEGTLNGQQTILVVQEFGAPVEGLAEAPVQNSEGLGKTQVASESEDQISQKSENPSPPASSGSPSESFRPSSQPAIQTLVAGQTTIKPVFDPFAISRDFALAIITLLILLIGLDLYIIRRRGILRINSRHLPHLLMLSAAASVIFGSGPGSIL